MTGRTRFAGALGAATAANLRSNARGFPSHLQALAIWSPHQRGYATEHHTPHSSPSSQPFPPPGFNAKQAKQPIPEDKKDGSSQSTQAEPSSTAVQTREADKAKLKEVGSVKAGEVKKGEKKEPKKLTLGQKFKKELQHYWDGTKLLSTEVRISTRLALKMAAGYELTRREHRQVCFHIAWWR